MDALPSLFYCFAILDPAAKGFTLPLVASAGCSIWSAQAHHVQSSDSQTLERTQSGSTFTTTDFSICVEPKTCWYPTGGGRKEQHKAAGTKKNKNAIPLHLVRSCCYISSNILNEAYYMATICLEQVTCYNVTY